MDVQIIRSANVEFEPESPDLMQTTNHQFSAATFIRVTDVSGVVVQSTACLCASYCIMVQVTTFYVIRSIGGNYILFMNIRECLQQWFTLQLVCISYRTFKIP